MDMYREQILDHYKHPRNFGTMETSDAKASAYNATCGDRISIEFKIHPDQIGTKFKIIEDIRFSGEGCAISMASASMLTEKTKGMTLQNVMKLDTKNMLAMLGTTLTPSRIKCATLPLEVLQKAVVCLRNVRK